MDQHGNSIEPSADVESQRLNNNLSTDQVKNSSAPSDCSQDSEASSNEFVNFDDQELANLPGAEFLSQFGNRVASDALHSALEGSRLDQPLTIRQPYDMGDLNFNVSKDAVNNERHSQPHNLGELDEFDPLAESQHLDFNTVVKQNQAHSNVDENQTAHQHLFNFDEGQTASKLGEPKHQETTHDDENKRGSESPGLDEHKKEEPELPKPKKPEVVADNADEEVIQRHHHSPHTYEEVPAPKETESGKQSYKFVNDLDNYNEIADNIRDAVQETHNHVDSLLDEFESVPQQQLPKLPSPVFQNEEQYSPSGDSGHDTLGELTNLKESDLPASESVSSGMRDLSPELTTYERNGPLTIPVSATGGHQQQPSVPLTDDLDNYLDQALQAPTPSKDISDPSKGNPNELNSGPPPSHSQPIHHSFGQGFQSFFKQSDGKAWIDFQSIPQPVQEILLWRNPKNSAIALTLSLAALILVAKFTFISLIAWGSLLVLGATLGFRVFKLVEGQVKKTDGSNPFRPYLEPEINLPQEKIHAQADVLVHHGQSLINHLRRLFLVENIFDSVKFGVLLWTLTYIGAWFSGITLVTIFVLGLFSVPKVYELYKEPIDEYIGLARQNVDKVHQIVQEKLPFLKQAEKSEKKD